MRLTDIQRLVNHWAKFPTIRDMVASYIGVEISVDRPAAPTTEEEFRQLFLMHGAVARG